MRFAAGLAQASRHPISRALVAEARARGLALPVPARTAEAAGAGVTGSIEGHDIVIGSPAFIAQRSGSALAGYAPPAPGETHLAVAIDGTPRAVLVFRDSIRDETGDTLAALREHGIERIVLVTGDQDAIAAPMARDLALDGYEADVSPQGKIEAVAREAEAGPTLMVGDGLNDAAALARADIGVALGARGSAGAAEAADVVILVDRLDRVADAIGIARHTRRIALQSVIVGIGLSFGGMVLAAAGYLPPLAGALAQEAIDIAVILNALRALGGDAARKHV
jgi:P-type E1-E2 ATPase